MQSVPEPDQPPPIPVEGQSQSRRLSDKIRSAFQEACDQEDILVAWELLNLLDAIAMQWTGDATGQQQRRRDTLVASHERRWVLSHPESAPIDIVGGSTAGLMPRTVPPPRA